MHFSPFFSNKAVKIKPESFFWWKIVLICHIACPKWIKIVDFRGFLHFRAENPGFRVKILKLQFLQKGSMKNFKNCTKQTPTLYIFMGGMSCLCSWKKLILPQKPTVYTNKLSNILYETQWTYFFRTFAPTNRSSDFLSAVIVISKIKINAGN